jgi:acylglycerol lipase
MTLRSAYLLLPLLLLAACAKPVRQAEAVYQQPAGIDERHFAPGDAEIQVGLRQWLPEDEPEKVILALHGFNDHSRAFQGLGEAMAAEGIAVVAIDQRGFGMSAQRGIWASAANLKRDAAQLVQAAKTRWPDADIYLLGESMGAAVAATAVADGIVPADQLKGLILVAPAVWGGDTFNPLYRAPLWLLAHFSPDTALTGKGLRILPSDNFPMLIALSKDPGMVRQSRADAVLGLVQLMDAGQEAGKRLPEKLPTLILYGANDQIVPQLPVARMAQNCIARLKDHCRARLYPDGFHMLLRDLNANTPMQDIAAWVKSPTAALPAGLDWQPDKGDDNRSAPALPGIGTNGSSGNGNGSGAALPVEPTPAESQPAPPATL